jgi:copper resistance protein B
MTSRARCRLLVVLTAVCLWPAGVLGQDHAQHEHAPPKPKPAEPGPLPDSVPPVTDEDRAAAFPDVHGHAVHDEGVNSLLLFDQLEWQTGDGVNGVHWDTKGWIGTDTDRFWFRTEGSGEDGDLAHGEAHLLYGRAIARWWDLVVGMRQDVRPGEAQTWAAVGLQGLAPYRFELESTAYVGQGGRTQVRFDVEYELLLTNRLILQPLVEVDLYGKDDPERGIGAGLSAADAGLRLRYEIRREVAPYIGVTWHRKFYGTADAARAAGEPTAAARLVLGVRLWM